MASSSTVRKQEADTISDVPLRPELDQLLTEILESAPFRTSKQCKNLLRYVVEHSLHDDDGALRERVIGAEVFGREPAYDTNEDPVVRIRAADIRKRLAQYYQSLEPGASGWHIELQPGSYRARFRQETRPVPVFEPPPSTKFTPSPLTVADVPPGRTRAWVRPVAGGIVAAIVLLAGLYGLPGRLHSLRPTAQQQFWAPIIASRQPVLIYLGCNVAYVLSSDFLARYRAAQHLPNTGPEIVANLPPDSSVQGRDLVPMQDTFVTTADTSAVVGLVTQLQSWNTPWILRSGRDLSMGDLRNRPSVMVGAFNNQWSMELTRDLPYSFREGIRIQDRDHPARSWSVPPNAHQGMTDDYALITRVLSSKTGGPSIVVAGIGEYGTQAAAEFLVNADQMRTLARSAPAGWQNKSMQAVLHVKVIDFQPVAVQVVATAYW